jgi:hypothetical protein
MTAADRWIERYLKRLAFGLFLQRFAAWFAGFLFVFGSAVLVVKLLMPAFWPHVLWLALASIPVTFAVWLLSRCNRFTRSESVALLDRKLDAGGLLMTLSETSDNGWAARLPQVESIWRESIPKVRPVRFAGYLVLPLVFAVGTCLVPLREANPEPILRNTVGTRAAEQLEEMLDLLQEADVLEEEEQQQLREQIEKLAKETKQTPLTHEKWETVDALRERLRMRLDTASLTVSKAQNAAMTLAKADMADARPLSLERIAQLEKHILEALQKLARDGELSRAEPGLRKELERLVKNGQFKLPQDAAARKKLLDELQDFLDQESDKLSECRKQCDDSPDGTCPFCGGRKQGGT